MDVSKWFRLIIALIQGTVYGQRGWVVAILCLLGIEQEDSGICMLDTLA